MGGDTSEDSDGDDSSSDVSSEFDYPEVWARSGRSDRSDSYRVDDDGERQRRRRENRNEGRPSMTYTIDADGNFSVDEPDAVAALGALLGAMQGRMDAEGRARREPTEEERAEMERIREEFLDVDDLPEGMSVPASVPPPGLDSTANAATGSDPLKKGFDPLKKGFDPLASVPTPTTAAPSTEEATAAVRAHADTVEADVDASRPPHSSAAGVDARVRFDARSGANPPGVSTDRSRLQAIFEREMDETSEALLGGSVTAGSGGAADDVNDARATAPPLDGDGDGPDAPRTLRETRDRLPFSPALNDELMDALTSVVDSSRAGGVDAREMMAAASARWEARRGAGGRTRRDPMNTRAGRLPTTASEEEDGEPEATATVPS